MRARAGRRGRYWRHADRPAVPADLDTIELIHALAEYEREPEAVVRSGELRGTCSARGRRPRC